MPDVTTSWRSVFEYDNVRSNYFSGNLFPSIYSQYAVVNFNGALYAFAGNNIQLSDSGLIPGYGCTYVQYHPDTGLWGQSDLISDTVAIQEALADSSVLPCYVMAQNLSSLSWNYYSSDSFHKGYIYAPTGNLFDGIYVGNVFSEVFALIPVLLVVFVSALGIRKAVSSLIILLKGA